MSSKRNSSMTVQTSMEFLRSKIASIEDKCKEFWKYLDDKHTLEPYQPPKLTEDEKELTPSGTSTCKSAEQPEKPSPPERDITMALKLEKIREPTCSEQSSESLLVADICEYDRSTVNYPICQNYETDCTCAEASREA